MKKAICIPVLLVMAMVLATGSGCSSALLTAMILIKGTDTEPEFDLLLKDKHKVAVVCQSLAMDQYRNATAPRDIGRQVAERLDENIKNKRLDIVSYAKIEEWLDDCDNKINSYVEIGKAKGIEADIVIAVELRDFRTQDPNSQGLYQGHANVLVKAYDCETGKTLHTKTLRIVDPPNMPVPASAVSEQAFRANFITVVAQRVACLFHRYDSRKVNRMDSDSMHMTWLQRETAPIV